MEISERLQKLQLEKDKISKEIQNLKSEIESKQKEQLDLLENPKSVR